MYSLKKTLLILLASCFFSGYAQVNSNTNSGCAAVMPANYFKLRNSVASTQNMVSTLKHDLCINKKFSIVFYIIADSLGNPGVTQANLDTCISILNRTFRRICVSFMNCSTVVIPHHPFNRWSKDTIDPVVTKNWYAENTINFYVPATILGEAAGYAYFPGGRDVIVVEKASVTSTAVPIHEMGHFFGLPHTFAEITTTNAATPSAELVARTNCYTNGDGFCDTEADCYPFNHVASAPCEHQAGAQDSNSEYYTPPLDNFMTYFKCRCRFTQEQYNFMANIILTARSYLH